MTPRYSMPGGTIYVRVPPGLKFAVTKLAAERKISVNQLVQRLLEQATRQADKKTNRQEAVAWLESLTEPK